MAAAWSPYTLATWSGGCFASSFADGNCPIVERSRWTVPPSSSDATIEGSGA